MAVKKAATAKKAAAPSTRSTPARKDSSPASSGAVIEARCGRCGRPVHASVEGGALVVVDPGQSEHDCPMA